MTTLKGPINPMKPLKPRKPVEPRKGLISVRHDISLESTFWERKYYRYEKYNRVECTKTESDEYDDEDLAVSITELLKLVPKGMSPDDVFIQLRTTSSDGVTTISDAEMWYETPYDYDAEFRKYQADLAKYKKELDFYNEVQLPAWKKENELYQAEKKKTKDLQKKAELEAQLAKIKNELKEIS
jgi:hypothetical protein